MPDFTLPHRSSWELEALHTLIRSVESHQESGRSLQQYIDDTSRRSWELV